MASSFIVSEDLQLTRLLNDTLTFNVFFSVQTARTAIFQLYKREYLSKAAKHEKPYSSYCYGEYFAEVSGKKIS